MKAFTLIVRILLIIGGLGILIIYPIMIENIDNDALFQPLFVIMKVTAVMTMIGLLGNLARALLLLYQESVKNKNHKETNDLDA